MKQLLLFNTSDSLKQAIENLFFSQEVIVKQITKKQFGLSLGVLTGIIKSQGENVLSVGKSFSDEMFLFVSFDQKSLSDFLTKYRNSGLLKVNLKAGLTPNNVTWSVYMLHEELMKEYIAMSKLK